MNPESPSPEEQLRTQAAVAWWLRSQKDEAALFSAEFQEWAAIPANEREFRAVEDAARALDALQAAPPIAEMRRSARRWFERQGSGKATGRRFFCRPAYAVAAAALLMAVAGSGYYLWFLGRPLSYQTDVGEQRAVALQDGSRILLDSNSEVDIRYLEKARAVTLARGRARFDVAHDAARPFSVTAAGETVIAVGTSFDVELRGSKVLVTLIRGRVLIKGAPESAAPRARAGAPVALSAGQQFVVSADSKPAIAPVDFSVTQAWEAGHLVFRGERLADAVEQINRYARQPISVDPSAASLRVSGVFNTGDTKSFVSAATELYRVEAVPGPDGAITLQKAP